MKQFNKILCFAFVLILVVSTFSISSFADNVITYSLYNFNFISSTDKPQGFTSVSTDIGTVTDISYTLDTDVRITGYYKISRELLADTSYTFSVSTKKIVGNGASFQIYLTDSLTNLNNAEIVCECDVNLTTWQNFTSQFVFPEKFVNKQVYLYFQIIVPKSIQHFQISDLTFTDNNPVTKDGFFDNLTDKLSQYFDFFVDMILYFEHPVELNADGVPINTETGEPVYSNPFESKLEEIFTKLQEWINSIEEFITNMNTARDNVVTYMDSGKELVDGVLGGLPLISAILIFVAGFYIVRKVVGQ